MPANVDIELFPESVALFADLLRVSLVKTEFSALLGEVKGHGSESDNQRESAKRKLRSIFSYGEKS